MGTKNRTWVMQNLAFMLVMVLMFAVLPSEVHAMDKSDDEDYEVGDPIFAGYNIPDNITWSLSTLDNGTINQNTYAGKTQILIFYRGNGLCGNSVFSIEAISKSDWINDENIVVIAVEADGADREMVAEFKNKYAPDCEDIVFAYGSTANSMLWSYVRKVLTDVSSVTFSISVIIDEDQNIRYFWDMNYNAAYYQAHLAALTPSITMPDVSSYTAYTFDVEGIADYEEAAAALSELNAIRGEMQLKALTLDAGLQEAAMQRAADISIYYSHTRPDGEGFSTAINTPFSGAGENIAIGYASAQDVTEAWKNSRGHLKNMINGIYTKVGIGCFYQEDGDICWVQIFANSASGGSSSKSGRAQEKRSVTALGDLLTINLSPSFAYTSIGKTQKLTLKNAVNKGLNYGHPITIIPSYVDSSNTKVATVNTDGIVSGISEGKTTIKVGIGNNLYKETAFTVSAVPIAVVDIKPTDWFYDAVMYAFGNDIMQGTGNGFEPNRSLNRAMLVQMLYNLEGKPSAASAGFSDVAEGSWYADAVGWASGNNIVSGVGDNIFAANNHITREQMAVMLYNYCMYKEIELPVVREESLQSVFLDNYSVSSWAFQAVETMYKGGILNGKGGWNFDPQGKATRAEVAQMFMNFMETIK